MYLTEEEYQIIKQALDDAEEMQKKYKDTLELLEKHIEFLTEIIVDNNLCEKTLKLYRNRFVMTEAHDVSLEAGKGIRFHRSDIFEDTMSNIAKIHMNVGRT